MADPFMDPAKAQLYQILAESGQTAFGGSPPPTPRFPGMGFLGPQLSSILPLIAPGISEIFRGPGGFAFNFDGNYNVLQALESRRFMEQLGQVRRDAAGADQPIIRNFLGGIYRTLNPGSVTGFGPDGRAIFEPRIGAALDRFSGAFTQMLPFLAAVAPDAVDAIGGQVGLRSAAADIFASSTRFLTNRAGQAGGADPGRLLTGIFNNIYAGGNANAVSGLGARRIGELFDELNRRGIISDTGDAEQTVRQASDQLKEYSKAISAVRDLFAANGRTNAPMAELVASLKALTQTGIGQNDPRELARIVSQVQGAARFSPLGLEGLVSFGLMANQAAGRLGIRSAVLGELPLEAAAAGQAFAGFGAASKMSPENLDRDAFTRAEAARRARGAASPLGNLVGAVLAQAEFAGGDSELGRLAARLRGGELPPELLRADAAGFLAGVAGRSGLDAATFTRQIFYAQGSNQSALGRNQAALRAVTGAGQRNDLGRMLSGIAQTYGIDLNRLVNAVTAASQTATGDTDLGRQVAGAIGRSDLGQQLATAFGELSQFNANQMGVAGDAALPFTITNLARGIGATGRTALAREQFEEYGRLSQSLTALGRGSMIGRAFQEIMGLSGAGAAGRQGGLAGLGQSLLRVLGLVSNDEVSRAMQAGGAGFLGNLPQWLAGAIPGTGGGGAAAGAARPTEVRLAAGQKLEITGTVKIEGGGGAVLNPKNVEGIVGGGGGGQPAANPAPAPRPTVPGNPFRDAPPEFVGPPSGKREDLPLYRVGG